MFGMYVFSALGGMGTMSDEFKDLAQVAADAVMSAMAADSHEVAKRRFATPVIAGGVLFVNAPGNGDVDAFSL